jgi:DNA-directed RNA polymerase specialized sigma24 family protein
VLRYAHDLSVAEVAELLDLAIPTVKTHLRRAVERLRREIRRTGHER